MTRIRNALGKTVVVLGCFLAAGLATAQERQLVVQLQSGRQFRGTLDAATSATQLVLRSDAGGLILRRPIRWDRIASATIDGQPVAVAALLEAAREQGTGDREQGTGKRKIVLRVPPAPLVELAESQAQPVLVPPPPVTSIAFDAYIANWDGDVETDGLVVELMPLDAWSNLTRASGVVEVELFASQRRIMLQHAPKSGGDTFERVERWSQAVNPEDIGPNGVRLRLPFGQIHPELDPDWLAYNYGLVHVRFTAPGSGVFDDSRDGIRIRPWAPNRDYLEMNTGRRFLPTENLGRRN